MKDYISNKKGFTLIELLVAVLIVGILGMFAISQYQKSVARVELAEVITATKTLKQAEERYYMIHDEYTKNLENLDMEIANNGNVKCYVTVNQIECYNKHFGLLVYLSSSIAAAHTECVANSATLASACESFLNGKAKIQPTFGSCTNINMYPCYVVETKTAL